MDKGTLMNIIFFGGMFVIMYFFMIRPKAKKDKEQREFLNALSKGDSVVTLGGIHGKISNIENELIVLDVDKGAKITIEKSSLSSDLSKKRNS